MKRLLLLACCLLVCCPISATYGELAFYTSNGTFTSSLPSGVDEENILVAKDLTGITVSGLTNTTGVQFDIMGNETLKNTANGQATVVGLDGDFTSAMVFPHLAGTRFQALELDLFPIDKRTERSFTFEVFGDFPSGPTTKTTVSTKNSQFIGVIATGGMLLDKVSISSDTAENIDQLKQIRVAGVIPAAVTPEPGSLLVWTAVFGMGALVWMRKRSRVA